MSAVESSVAHILAKVGLNVPGCKAIRELQSHCQSKIRGHLEPAKQVSIPLITHTP